MSLSTIQASSFLLRPFKETDLKNLFTYINAPSIQQYTTIDVPWSYEHARWWLQFVIDVQQLTPKSEYHFVIEKHDQFLGSIGVINIKDHRAEIGYWMVDNFTNKGIMTEAIKRVTDYSFKREGLTRLFAPVLTFNHASVRTLEKAGYNREALMRHYLQQNGTSHDAYMYACINPVNDG